MKNIENVESIYYFIDEIEKITRNNYNYRRLKKILEYTLYIRLLKQRKVKFIITKINFGIIKTIIRKIYYRIITKIG